MKNSRTRLNHELSSNALGFVLQMELQTPEIRIQLARLIKPLEEIFRVLFCFRFCFFIEELYKKQIF